MGKVIPEVFLSYLAKRNYVMCYDGFNSMQRNKGMIVSNVSFIILNGIIFPCLDALNFKEISCHK